MSRANLWSIIVFTVFAFATVIIFFWIRDGSLSKAGQSMDAFLSDAGDSVARTTGEVVEGTGDVIHKATDGDDRT